MTISNVQQSWNLTAATYMYTEGLCCILKLRNIIVIGGTSVTLFLMTSIFNLTCLCIYVLQIENCEFPQSKLRFLAQQMSYFNDSLLFLLFSPGSCAESSKCPKLQLGIQVHFLMRIMPIYFSKVKIASK